MALSSWSLWQPGTNQTFTAGGGRDLLHDARLRRDPAPLGPRGRGLLHHAQPPTRCAAVSRNDLTRRGCQWDRVVAVSSRSTRGTPTFFELPPDRQKGKEP